MNLLGSPPQLFHLPSSLHTLNTKLPDLVCDCDDRKRAQDTA